MITPPNISGRSRLAWVGLALGAFGLGCVGLVFAVLAAGFFLAWPAHRSIGAPPPDLGAEAVQISSASGASLSGWFVPGQPGKGAVVLMHGVNATRLVMLRRAYTLSRAGFAVLLFDFQAHGESTGRRITFGYRESLDAASAVAFLRAKAPGERLAAIGQSLGGAAALLGQAPLPVDGLVLESVYPDIDHALGNRFNVVLGPVGRLMTPWLVPLFDTVLESVLGFRAADLRPIDHIGAVTAPLLIASGTADDRTPTAETQSLYDHASAPKQLWLVEGAHHVDLEAYTPEAYWRIVMPFLTKTLQTPK